MILNRRAMVIGASAALFSGCGGPAVSIRQDPPTTRFKVIPNPAFDAWLAGFRSRALAQGFDSTFLNTAFRKVGYLPDVVERDRNQTEFVRSLEDYLAISASDDKISTGRAMLARHSGVLAEIEARHGVEPAVVTAIWGVESRYGARRGNVPVISALATLTFDGRRRVFFEKQLFAALRILRRGDVAPANMTGSWAGAMGHTQFIPTTFEAYAVDHDGDGRRNIWGDDPTDALASAAAYLNRSGWQRGQPWGIEVRLPGGFNSALAGRGTSRSTGDWAALGIQSARGGGIPNHGPASLILPAGPNGPAFLIFRNFTVLTRYNNAEKYVIGVGHLSDRIKGGPPLRGTFPPDANGMTISDRRTLQRRLKAAGYDIGDVDGVIGDKTRAAIRAYQTQRGLPVTGEPTLDLLSRLS